MFIKTNLINIDSVKVMIVKAITITKREIKENNKLINERMGVHLR
jgi:hypothetical protein